MQTHCALQTIKANTTQTSKQKKNTQMRSDLAVFKRTCFRVQPLNLSRNQIGMRSVLSAAGNLQPVILKVLFIPFGIWMIIEEAGLFSSAMNSRQPRTDINAPALMDPSHCCVAFQTPEGTVLLVGMQSFANVLVLSHSVDVAICRHQPAALSQVLLCWRGPDYQTNAMPPAGATAELWCALAHWDTQVCMLSMQGKHWFVQFSVVSVCETAKNK